MSRPRSTSMTKIFLTNPPLNMAETPLQYHRPLAPMGLAYLGAKLEDEFTGGAWSRHVRKSAAEQTRERYRPSGTVGGQDNMFLSFYGRYSYNQLRERIADFAGADADLFIGLSVLSDGMRNAKQMLRSLRRDFPHAVLMVGGPHATSFPEDFYDDPVERQGRLVDYVVKNEGELAILGIVEGKLGDLASVERHGEKYGIAAARCSFGDDGYCIIDGGQYGAKASIMGEHVLDTLPPPALFLFEDEHGELPYRPDTRYGLQGPAANINSSRGCPHRCTFCTIPTLAPGYRTLSPQRILELLRFIQKRYSVTSVFFREDNFMYEGGTLAGDRWPDIEALCEEMPAAAPNINWAIEARADNVIQQTSRGGSRLDLMRAAGLSGIYMGIEAGADEMLKLYVKGSTVHTMSQAVTACNKHGIAVVATSCYGDHDLLLRRDHSLVDLANETYRMQLFQQRDSLLTATRSFMDTHDIPADRREEYALVGIPVSALYRVLDRARESHPALVEHYDPVTRYIFPKGFEWWSTKIYNVDRAVRGYYGAEFKTAALLKKDRKAKSRN